MPSIAIYTSASHRIASSAFAEFSTSLANLAMEILKAKENNIPIKKDEDLIELLSQINIDKEIPDSMYKAVAEIFSFIYDLSNNKNKLDEKLKEIASNRV